MFEIFLFINPIGIYCYDTEKLIIKITDKLGVDVSFHFIPVVTSNIIREDIIRRKQDCQTITNIPDYTVAAYRALEDYHAIQLACGNKKARSYIYHLQQKISDDFSLYTTQLTEKIKKDLHIRTDKVERFKSGDYIASAIKQDQKTVEEWNIVHIPSMVIFNEQGSNSGILIDGPVSNCKLCKIFEAKSEKEAEPDLDLAPRSYLRLI